MPEQQPPAQQSPPDNATRLLELAQAHFKDLGGLLPAEEKVIRAAARGEYAALSPQLNGGLRKKLAQYREEQVKARHENKPEPQPDDELKPFLPAFAHTWGDDRKLRADVIAWLRTHPEARALVSHRGVRTAGARIEGKLDRSYARIPFPLSLHVSSFAEPIFLSTGAPAGDIA